MAAQAAGGLALEHRPLSTDSDDGERAVPSGLVHVVHLCRAGGFVVDPRRSGILPIWDALVSSLLLELCFSVPYELGFAADETSTPSGATAVFLLDALLQFFVMRPPCPPLRRWVRRPRCIAAGWLRSPGLWLDLVALLPLDWLGPRLPRLPRLLLLARLPRLRRRYACRGGLRSCWLRLLSSCTCLVLAVHWVACFYGLALRVERLGRESADWGQALEGSKPLLAEQPQGLYVSGLYWSTMTITSIGYGDVAAWNGLEAWLVFCVMLACAVFWAQVVGSMSAVCLSLQSHDTTFEEHMDSLSSWQQVINLPWALRRDLRAFFRCQKERERREGGLLGAMAPGLRAAVARRLHGDLLGHFGFCRPCDGFVVDLCRALARARYPPRETVRLRGFCYLNSGVAISRARVMSPGSAWGMTALLVTNPELVPHETALALSHLEVQFLARCSLDELAARYPLERRRLRRQAALAALRRALLCGYVQPRSSAKQSWRASARASAGAEPLAVRGHHEARLPGRPAPRSRPRESVAPGARAVVARRWQSISAKTDLVRHHLEESCIWRGHVLPFLEVP